MGGRWTDRAHSVGPTGWVSQNDAHRCADPDPIGRAFNDTRFGQTTKLDLNSLSSEGGAAPVERRPAMLLDGLVTYPTATVLPNLNPGWACSPRPLMAARPPNMLDFRRTLARLRTSAETRAKSYALSNGVYARSLAVSRHEAGGAATPDVTHDDTSSAAPRTPLCSVRAVSPRQRHP